MSRTHSWSCGLLQSAWLTSRVPESGKHILSSELRLGPCHTQVGTQLFPMALASSHCWHLLLQLGLLSPLGFLHNAKPQLFSMTPSVLGLPLPLWLHLHKWLPWLLIVPNLSCSHDPCLPSKQVAPGRHDQVWVPAQGTVLSTSEYSFFVLTEQTLLKRFHLSDAGLCLISTSLLAPADQHHLSQ